MSLGPTYWGDEGGTPAFVGRFWFDGAMLFAGTHTPPYDIDGDAAGTLVRTLAGGSVVQVPMLGGTAPLSRMPWRMDLLVHIIYEEDLHAINRAIKRGLPVDVWFDFPFEDEWWVAGNQADLGDTWRTGAKLPYNLVTGINQSTRPPKAWKVSSAGALTELTVVTSGLGAGEILVPDSDGYTDLKTSLGELSPPGDEYLRFRYHPMFLAKVITFSAAYEDHNNLIYRLDIEEVQGGVYTLAPGF